MRETSAIAARLARAWRKEAALYDPGGAGATRAARHPSVDVSFRLPSYGTKKITPWGAGLDDFASTRSEYP
jgi:hypothetical protein